MGLSPLLAFDEVNAERTSAPHHPQHLSISQMGYNKIDSVQQFREQFNWKASELSQEEEMIQNQYKSFQRKVAIAKQYTEGQLLSISRKIERSRSKPIHGKSEV